MIETYYSKTNSSTPPLFKKNGFVAGWSIPHSGDSSTIPMEDIPPFLRTLLVTDGTVTKSLEAYFWEPVEVETLAQGMQVANSDVNWLEVLQGDDVLTREVKLQGKHSKNTYASAFSIIRPQIIPVEFREKLLSGEIGIGMLIRDSGMESYREVLEIGCEEYCPNRDQALQPSIVSMSILYRTYRIVMGGESAILITERFPKALYI